MAHMLEENRGVFRTAAWHGLGEIPGETIRDLEQFLRAGSMWYEVTKEPAYQRLLTLDGQGNPVIDYRAVDGQVHLVRGDDGKIVSDHTVSPKYDPMDPQKMCRIVEGFCEQGFATPDAGFSLYDGQSEVISLRLDYGEPVGSSSEVWNHFLVIQNYHGSGKLRGKMTSVRVVCHNTVTAAFATGAEFSISHRGGIFDRTKFAVETWKSVKDYLRVMGERYGKLLLCPVDIAATIDTIVGIKAGERMSAQQEEKRNRLIAEANNPSRGTEGKTAADVFNAVTAYATHDRYGMGEKKTELDMFASNLDGVRASFQQKALDTLLAIAAV